MSTLTNARAVANFFLEKGVREGVPIDQLKLQKLVYYAFAWYIANYNSELFSEDICAWPHGPVVQELWREFKRFGRDSITTLATQLQVSPVGIMETVTPKIPQNPQVISLLDAVWKSYKGYTGIQLSNMTHATDEPWSIMKARESLIERPRISAELIKALFQGKLASARAATT